MKTPAALAATLAALLLTVTLHAQVPGLINYQSRVAVGGINFDGTGAFKFALVNAAGNTAYWTNDNTHLDGTEPNAAVSLPVVKGLYSVLLGDGTLPNMQPVPSTVFAHTDVRLRVWFNDGLHGSQLLTPDQRIAAVGYAMAATTANTVYGDGSAGDFTAPVGETTLDVSNPQFNNFNVPAGSILHVPSGLTIRCANAFSNVGTIIVDPAGGVTINFGPADAFPANPVATVNRGITKTAAYSDGFAPRGGRAFLARQIKTIFSVAPEGGGTGYPDMFGTYALGGGSLRLVVKGILTNAGTIHAIGQNGQAGDADFALAGGGGGGGGVIILASATLLVQSGEINASGGDGGADAQYMQYIGEDFDTLITVSVGPGGAGGGGLIRLLSPVIISNGQNIVSKGAKQQQLPSDRSDHMGGSGGASAGDGAGYGDEDAGDGIVLIDHCNPTSLLGN